MPDVRSVALGFWVDVGSRDETPEMSGASHFLEHLLFKGTEHRTARMIAESVEVESGAEGGGGGRDFASFEDSFEAQAKEQFGDLGPAENPQGGRGGGGDDGPRRNRRRRPGRR